MYRHSKVTGLIDGADTSITSNITTVKLAKKFTPTLGESTLYTINFDNTFYNPQRHRTPFTYSEEHSRTLGGIISSSGFKISGDATNEMFFDDDGSGNLRIYYLSAGERIFQDYTAGTVDYENGTITTTGLKLTTVGDVDGVASSQIRIIAIPDSNDIIPKRNQVLEIDFTNLTITGEVDTVAVGDSNAGTLYVARPSQVPLG
jgi:hypothetical protein